MHSPHPLASSFIITKMSFRNRKIPWYGQISKPAPNIRLENSLNNIRLEKFSGVWSTADLTFWLKEAISFHNFMSLNNA